VSSRYGGDRFGPNVGRRREVEELAGLRPRMIETSQVPTCAGNPLQFNGSGGGVTSTISTCNLGQTFLYTENHAALEKGPLGLNDRRFLRFDVTEAQARSTLEWDLLDDSDGQFDLLAQPQPL